MAIDEFFTEEFWRQELPSINRVKTLLLRGADPSYHWCIERLQIYSHDPDFPFHLAETIVLNCARPDKRSTREKSHHFLYAPHRGDIFVADAFTVNIDPAQPKGFFGPLEDAPDRERYNLKEFYDATLRNLS